MRIAAFPEQCYLEDQALDLEALSNSSSGSDYAPLPVMTTTINSISGQIALAA